MLSYKYRFFIRKWCYLNLYNFVVVGHLNNYTQIIMYTHTTGPTLTIAHLSINLQNSFHNKQNAKGFRLSVNRLLDHFLLMKNQVECMHSIPYAREYYLTFKCRLLWDWSKSIASV